MTLLKIILWNHCMMQIIVFCMPGIEVVGSIGQTEMLHRTNLLAIVSGGAMPKYAENTGIQGCFVEKIP